jgi:hypothetical protein
MTQHVDVDDGVTPVGQRHRHVDQNPAPVVTGVNEAPASTLDSSPVSPVRSASRRTATDPACATTPVPSAVTETRKTTSSPSKIRRPIDARPGVTAPS